MLITQPEKASFWMGSELGYTENGDFVLYEAVSCKAVGGRATWQVRRRGTNEQTRNWGAKHMAQALEAAELENKNFGQGKGGAPAPPRTGMVDRRTTWLQVLASRSAG
jgi:hypothetical protein